MNGRNNNPEKFTQIQWFCVRSNINILFVGKIT